MLDKFIPLLISDLELGDTTLESGGKGSYSLPIDDDLTVTFTTIDNGFTIKSLVAPIPKTNEGAFLTQLMEGNLFGKETNNAVLGINHGGDTLTLTQVIDYHIDYKTFKQMLESFLNVAEFWRDQAKAKG